MKANELMVGDYVYNHRNWECPIVEIHKNSALVIAKHYGEEEFLLSDLRPIPLTPEILEKNGFEKVYDKYKLPNYRIKWNGYTDLYFTVFTGVDGYWNPIGLNVITGGIPATVDYVHQLQNALRLCGINHEIIL